MNFFKRLPFAKFSKFADITRCNIFFKFCWNFKVEHFERLNQCLEFSLFWPLKYKNWISLDPVSERFVPASRSGNTVENNDEGVHSLHVHSLNTLRSVSRDRRVGLMNLGGVTARNWPRSTAAGAGRVVPRRKSSVSFTLPPSVFRGFNGASRSVYLRWASVGKFARADSLIIRSRGSWKSLEMKRDAYKLEVKRRLFLFVEIFLFLFFHVR